MNGIYLYFVNKIVLDGRYWDFKRTSKFCRSVGLVFWCLVIGPPPNLPDMTGGPTVFRKVDRSVKQIKFHLKSYLISDRKTGINSNNLPKPEVRNLCFETFSV